MTSVVRSEEIAQWWNEMSLGGWLLVNATTELRLFQAFSQVLQAMPDDAFLNFLELNPLVICQQGTMGAVFGCMSPGVWQPFIYLAPSIAHMTDQNLLDRVAHEIAHVILRHYQSWEIPRGVREAEADRLSQTWGFRPRYTRAMLRRLRNDEEYALSAKGMNASGALQEPVP
jgi:hypothetical protein